MTDWTCDSNQALRLSLVRAPEDKEHEKDVFHPTFTYPIYGEDEKIYGYDGLNIDLRFASGSLAQYLSVTYAAKLPASTVDDVKGKLAENIPEDFYTDETAFSTRVAQDATAFQPIGQLIHSYSRTEKGKGRESGSAEQEEVIYEAYHSTWATPGFQEFHRRMQLFILLYIEAGSYINEDEDSWEFVVLYEKRKRRNADDVWTYHFVGYSSLYNFYCFPERIRMRLSQFVILPPYQRLGHGSELYKSIYNLVLSRDDVSELTVEDPAEAFEDLRDRNDLRMLRSHAQFMLEGFGEPESYGGGKVQKGKGKAKARSSGGKLGPPAEKGWVEKWRTSLKIAGRQFDRLIEMLILDRLDASNERAYRLQVKERLYRFNFEILAQMDKEERLEKLEETYQSVIEDYRRILAMVH